MGEPFRDDLGDPSAATRFAQHVGVAEDILDQIEQLPRRIDAWRDGDGVTQPLMDELARQWAKGWQDAWDQLAQAREVVARRGRDAGGFDAARAAAGDLYVDVAVGKAVRAGNEVHVSWRNAPVQHARDAIAALRAAMPEVVVVKQAPIDVDLRPTSNKLIEIVYVLGGIAVFAVVAYVLYRAVTG